MDLTASIVVNTYNRARSLERLLPSLDHLDCARFEVVVVNGPSTDDTDAVLERYASRVKTARCETANLSRSRNIGIRAAAGDVVVFIDDDALPEERTWLSRLLAAFERDSDGRLGAAGGASIHRDTEWREFDGGWTSDYAEQRFNNDAASQRGGRWYRRTVGNNSAFRRTALVAIGGFDEHYPYYLDEADVCLRLSRAGYEVAYLEDAAVRHYPAMSPMGPPFIRNRRLIARSDTYYCLKNGNDRWPRRLLQTLRRAPTKHFVRELPGLLAEGRISSADLRRVRWQWARGVLEGLALGTIAPRATRLTSATPPALRPFQHGVETRPLSIALLTRRLPPDPHAGGVARYTYDLARGLHARGHRVTIVTESEVPLRREALGFEVVGVRSTAPPKGLSQTPVLAQNIAYAEPVAAFVRAQQRAGRGFDVVHATNWGLEALGLAQAAVAPLALMLVTPLESVIAAEGWSTGQDLSANIELDQWIIDRADRILAPSHGVLDTYRGRPHWRERRVGVVALGTAPAPPQPRRSASEKCLLFVGRHERRKGIHVLLEALPRLLERHADWRCDLVGNNGVASGPGTTFESTFRERHSGAAWLERVTFHGPVSDDALPGLYANADLFVAPSLFESFGLIYLEAMQHGVPVVATRVGGVPDVVTDGLTGLLVAPDDAVALGEALERLMTDATIRARMGAAASAATRTTHGHLAMADRMLLEYRHAIEAHAARTTQGAATACAASTVSTLSVSEQAVEALERAASTRGLGLAYRAAAALDDGDRADASRLIEQALTLTGHPDHYAMAVELALAEDDMDRAAEFALRGFEVTRDDSDACLVFAAVMMQPRHPACVPPAGWDSWRCDRAPVLAARLLAVALVAIRSNRDGTAVVLLEACRALPAVDHRILAQVRYHLGSTLKRRGRLTEARRHLEDAHASGRQRLPPALQAALHFHLGDLDLTAGRATNAAAHFRACLTLNPGHGRARARLDDAIAASAAA